MIQAAMTVPAIKAADVGKAIEPMVLSGRLSPPPHSLVFILNTLVKKERGRKTTEKTVKLITERF